MCVCKMLARADTPLSALRRTNKSLLDSCRVLCSGTVYVHVYTSLCEACVYVSVYGSVYAGMWFLDRQQ